MQLYLHIPWEKIQTSLKAKSINQFWNDKLLTEGSTCTKHEISNDMFKENFTKILKLKCRS